MGGIAAIGEAIRVQGLGLAGVLVLPGDDPEQVRTSWASLPDGILLVILTPSAATEIETSATGPLTVVMPP